MIVAHHGSVMGILLNTTMVLMMEPAPEGPTALMLDPAPERLMADLD